MTPRAPDFSPPFRLGELLVEPEHLRVIDAGEATALEPLHMAILVHLAGHAPDTVSDDTLFKAVWKTTVYGENALNKAMHGLRKALKDDARAPRYIKRVHGRGYCVIAPVTRIGDYRDQPGSSPVAAWSRRNPFVGLQAFDESHREVFCGRQRFVERTLTAIRGQLDSGQRFVFLQGPSGCGKTSLLRAGVIPALTQSGNHVDADVLAIAHCDFAGMQDGDAAGIIASALMAWQLDGRAVFGPQSPADLVMRLIEHPDAIATTIEDALRRRLPAHRKKGRRTLLLLVIDHAETLVAAKTITPEQRDAALTLLRGVHDSSHALILMNCRGDFAPRLTEALPELADWKSGQGHVEVTRPNEAEISEIIRAPALKAGLVYEQESDTLLRLDDVLRDAAMREPDVLPLLQHTLHGLYERDHAQHVLSFATYREIGGLEGALARHAEAVFATLPAAAQARLDDVLARLVVTQPDSDSISGKRAHWSTIADPDARQLVHEFIRARLFVGELSDGLPGFGVAHEALLRQWPRASEWAVNNRRLLKARERLHRAAQRWSSEGRHDDHLLNPGQPLNEAREAARHFGDEFTDEQRSFLRASEAAYQRKRRLKFGAILTLSLLTLTSGLFAIRANRAQHEADARRGEAQVLADYMLVDLADQLRQQGQLKLLRGISEKSLQNLRKRPTADLNEAETVSLSKAWLTVGEVMMQTGQLDAAMSESFLPVDAMLREAIKRFPTSDAVLNEVGQVAYWIGYDEYERHRYDQARAHWEQYRDISAELMQRTPGQHDWWRETAYAFNNLGTLAMKVGRPADALDVFRRSESLKLQTIKAAGGDPGSNFDLADTRSWIAQALQATGDLQAAHDLHTESIATMRALLKTDHAAAHWRNRLTDFLQLDAELSIARGDLDRAERDIAESITTLESLHEKQRDSVEWKLDLVKAYQLGGYIAILRGERTIAHQRLDAALYHVLDLQEKDETTHTDWQRIEASVLAMRADLDEDVAALDRAIATLETLSRTASGDIYITMALADAMELRARHRADHGDPDGAERDCQRIEALLGPHAATSRDYAILAPLATSRWLRASIRKRTPTLTSGASTQQEDIAPLLERLQAIGYRAPGFIAPHTRSIDSRSNAN